jgi:predicted metalloendopeptidase
MCAKRAAAAEGKSKPEQDQAYRDAIVHHQDEFYERVSSQWGHTRVGPQRERVSRMEALAMQRIEEAKKIATKAWERKRAQIIAEAEAEGRRRHSVKIETMEPLIADMARKYDALMGVVDKLKARNFELQSELHEFRNAPAL